MRSLRPCRARAPRRREIDGRSTSSRASSDRRSPDEYASSNSARSRSASGSSLVDRRPAAPLRRATAPTAVGAATSAPCSPAHGSSLSVPVALDQEAIERAPRRQHAREAAPRQPAAVQRRDEARAAAARSSSRSGVVAGELAAARRRRAGRPRACAAAASRDASANACEQRRVARRGRVRRGASRPRVAISARRQEARDARRSRARRGASGTPCPCRRGSAAASSLAERQQAERRAPCAAAGTRTTAARRRVVEPFARLERGLRARSTARRARSAYSRISRPTSRRARAVRLLAAPRPTAASRPAARRNPRVEAVVQHGERRLEVRRGEQRERRAVQLFADRVVLVAVRGSARAACARARALLSRSARIWRSAMRNRVAAVRMRHEDLARRLGVVLEERRVAASGNRRLHLHPSRSFRRLRVDALPMHRVRIARHSPSNTVRAGPVISTGAPSPGHAIVSSPPRVSTRRARRAARAACPRRPRRTRRCRTRASRRRRAPTRAGEW